MGSVGSQPLDHWGGPSSGYLKAACPLVDGALSPPGSQLGLRRPRPRADRLAGRDRSWR